MLTPLRSAGLPRHLGAGLLLLALALQVFAPAAGLLTRARAAELAASDAQLHFVICGHAPGADATAALPVPAPADCDRCPFCRCTAAVPLAVPPALNARRVTWHPIAWPIPPPVQPPEPPRICAQARAPPLSV